MKIAQAGERNRRIRIQRATFGENDLGEEVALSWARLATRWAKVAPAPGRERFATAETVAEAVTTFDIAWSTPVADVSPKDRIEYPVASGKNYNILSVDELGFHEALLITAGHRGDKP